MVSKSVLAGALACMMLGQPATEPAQQSAPPQQSLPDGPKPQAIPDAPTPQTLPTVTPGRGTTPESNGPPSFDLG